MILFRIGFFLLKIKWMYTLSKTLVIHQIPLPFIKDLGCDERNILFHEKQTHHKKNFLVDYLSHLRKKKLLHELENEDISQVTKLSRIETFQKENHESPYKPDIYAGGLREEWDEFCSNG